MAVYISASCKVFAFCPFLPPFFLIRSTENGYHSMEFAWYVDQWGVRRFYAPKVCSEGTGETPAS